MPRYIFDLDKWKNETSKDAKDWVEVQFPEKHYGYNIAVYEAWGLRPLFEQAYMAGKESASEVKFNEAYNEEFQSIPE